MVLLSSRQSRSKAIDRAGLRSHVRAVDRQATEFSGHGVCGMSRLSLRGIVATVFYLLAGGLTLVVFRHVLGVL